MGELEKYVRKALEMGAESAKTVSVQDLVFDPRTILKCMYGCEDWGKSWSCPSAPKALMPWEAEKVLRRYSRGMIVHTHDAKQLQEITYQLEIEAFYDGHHFAFALAECYLCETCVFPDPCKFPAKARPSMQALGIDVYATVKKLGLPIKILKSKDETPNYYGLVLLE
jgi:predicted metal-binding protein